MEWMEFIQFWLMILSGHDSVFGLCSIPLLLDNPDSESGQSREGATQNELAARDRKDRKEETS